MADESRLTHVDESGAARMVDVSTKEPTARSAKARGRVETTAEVLRLLRRDGLPKGDALAVARVAAILAVKKTPEIIPLCHPLAISGAVVDFALEEASIGVEVAVTTTDRTGVEMEALTGVAAAALTIVDMIKAVDKSARITDVEVVEKSGGRGGDWSRGRS